MRKDAFSTLHPINNFYFYIFVIAASMWLMHPVYLSISVVSALGYSLYLNGSKTIKLLMLGIMPLMFLGAGLNPLFNHAGATILTYLNDGNPLTLESIIYGIAAAVMFTSVILWFSCYNMTMSSDKFLYVFGQISPKLSLIISMSLRFVPLYSKQLKQIREGQKAIGKDVNAYSLGAQIKSGLQIFSMLVTWALENAIITSDSMQARGYGLKGRTNYALYHFNCRDRRFFMAMLILSMLIVTGNFVGISHVRYFPTIDYRFITKVQVSHYLLYAVFCNLPLILNLTEAYQWQRIKSNI